MQLAILLKYKLLKTSIIRTKMWSLKIRQYDLKCYAEQLANSICNFLTVATDPAFPFQNEVRLRGTASNF